MNWQFLRPDGIHIETLAGEPIDRGPTRITWSPVMAEKGGHKHFMHKEIHEQPRALTDTLRGRMGPGPTDVTLDEGMLDAIASAGRIMLTACGTSFHACLVGRLALEELARLRCEVELASELRYRSPILGEDTLVLAVSQSGETADTLAAIGEAQAEGSRVLSLVNVLDSSIARRSEWTLYTHAGPEIGVASTKAFVTQVAALMLLAVGVGLKRGLDRDRAETLLDGLRQVPRLIQRFPGTRIRDHRDRPWHRPMQICAVSRPRVWLSDRPRGGSKTQRDLVHPRRRLCRRRNETWSDCIDRTGCSLDFCRHRRTTLRESGHEPAGGTCSRRQSCGRRE